MGVGQDVTTVYGKVHGQGMVVCAHCGTTKAIALADFPAGKALKVTCGCGHRFCIRIEVRQRVRRPVHLPGQYEKNRDDLTRGRFTGRMVVENLSQQGLRFRTASKRPVRLHELISVHFTLDDAKRSPVSKSAVVKSVADYVVGVQYLDFDTYNDTNRTITMYLMSR